MVSLFLTVITMMSLPFVPKRELSRRAQKYQLLVQIYQLLSLLQAGQKRETLIERIESLVGSKGGPAMNAFASHHHSNPGVDTICGFYKFVVGSLLCSKRFFSGYYGFPLSLKTNTYKFLLDRELGRKRTAKWMCYFYNSFIEQRTEFSGVYQSCLASFEPNKLRRNLPGN